MKEFEISGFCECGAHKLYFEKYDTFFCPICDKWLEGRCSDGTCVFCSRRPEKPSVALKAHQ